MKRFNYTSEIFFPFFFYSNHTTVHEIIQSLLWKRVKPCIKRGVLCNDDTEFSEKNGDMRVPRLIKRRSLMKRALFYNTAKLTYNNI